MVVMTTITYTHFHIRTYTNTNTYMHGKCNANITIEHEQSMISAAAHTHAINFWSLGPYLTHSLYSPSVLLLPFLCNQPISYAGYLAPRTLIHAISSMF
jgi:hypothetical protein